jgi:hypothetical protein
LASAFSVNKSCNSLSAGCDKNVIEKDRTILATAGKAQQLTTIARAAILPQ